LAAAAAQRNSTLAAQQIENRALPVWRSTGNVAPSAVTATGDRRITVSLVNLRENYCQQTVEITKISKARGLIGGLNAQVAGLNKQISDSDKAHEAEITAVKAEAQKSKRKCEDGVILVLLAVCFCTFRKTLSRWITWESD
jgi:hypothetical protein